MAAKTKTDNIYQTLHDEIVQLVLPPGSQLVAEDLKTRYGASAQSIREAILKLVADCLVISEPQQKYRVSPMSLDDYAEITRLRKVLERIALTESITSGDDQWEAEVVAAYHQLSLVRAGTGSGDDDWMMLYNQRNAAFHDVLASRSNSQWVHRFRHMLYNAAERYRMVHRSDILAPAQKEHQAIMKAALERDVEAACRLTDQHIVRAFNRFVKLLPNWPGLPPMPAKK